KMPTTLNTEVSRGTEITPAQKRGATTRDTGWMAIISMALSCSVVFIRPISAVTAEPARLEINSADSTGPSSRTRDRATTMPTMSPEPKRWRVSYICSPSTRPTKSPDTRMITRDITPIKYISRITSPGRRRQIPDASNIWTKNRAASPRLIRLPVTVAPRRRITAAAKVALALISGVSQHGVVVRRGIVESHRAIGLGVDKLAHIGVVGAVDLVHGALGDHHALGHQVHIVNYFQGFLDIVGDHDGGGPQGVV